MSKWQSVIPPDSRLARLGIFAPAPPAAHCDAGRVPVPPARSRGRVGGEPWPRRRSCSCSCRRTTATGACGSRSWRRWCAGSRLRARASLSDYRTCASASAGAPGAWLHSWGRRAMVGTAGGRTWGLAESSQPPVTLPNPGPKPLL